MTNKPRPQDIFDTDRKTGALILGSNRLDDYATKYLSSRCPEALAEPMPLPVDTILEKEGLSVVEESLSSTGDIFGCCLLLDSEVPVYDRSTSIMKKKFFPRGTILIDPNSEARLSEGCRRNTLIHEAIHWEKDRTFFQMKAVRESTSSASVSPFLCRTSESFLQPSGNVNARNQLRWLEWQAHRLAPRILMPRRTFRAKALNLMGEVGFGDSTQPSDACDRIVESLSEFFIASGSSVKYRLREVDLTKELSIFPDYDVVIGSISNRDTYAAISPAEAFAFIEKNPLLASWVKEGRFVFVDGYFVLADPRYIEQKNGSIRLKKSARNNLRKCALCITSQPYRSYANFEKDLYGLAYLYRTTDVDKRLLAFHPEYQPKSSFPPEEAYIAFANQLFHCEDDIGFQKILCDPTTTLCECLYHLMERKGIKYPEQFEELTQVTKNYHGRIKNGNANNMKSDTLFAICIGLKLGLRTVQKLFAKSDNKLNEFEEPNRTRLKIIETMPGLSIGEFNSILRTQGLAELGSKMKT